MHYKILEHRLEKTEAEMDEKQRVYLALLKRHKEALATIHDLKQDKLRLKNELSEIKQRLGMAERKIKDMENENGYSILYTYEHRGFVLQQTSYNWHYMIINANGRPVMHCQYNEKLTEEEVKEEYEQKIKQLEEAKQKVESKVDDLNRKIKAEKEKASAAAESEKAMKEKYDAAQAELIKAKKAANASGNQELAKINILFGDIQNKIRELNEAFAVVGNAELEDKVKGVLSEQLKG